MMGGKALPRGGTTTTYGESRAMSRGKGGGKRGWGEGVLTAECKSSQEEIPERLWKKGGKRSDVL